MKTNQKGFAYKYLLVGIVVVIGGVLGFVFWQNVIQKDAYVNIADWKVRFSSDASYKLSSSPSSKESDNTASYSITIDELAKKCSSYTYLGYIVRFKQPDAAYPAGPNAGKTPNQLYKDDGIMIDGKLYVHRGPQRVCSKADAEINKQFDDAAAKLKNDFKTLQAYS